MCIYVIDSNDNLYEFNFVSSIYNHFDKGEFVVVINYYDVYDHKHWHIFRYNDIKSMEIIL